MLQIAMYKKDDGNRYNAYAEFVKSLKDTDKDFVEKMLLEFEKTHSDQNATTLGAVNQVVPDACNKCPNHPSNGGSGNCNCMLGMAANVTC